MNVLEKIRNAPFSIQIVIIVGVLVAAFVFMGGEKLKQYERDYLVSETREQIERVFDVFIASNLDSVIAEDIPLLESAVLSTAMSNPDFINIKIFNEDGNNLFSWESDNASQAEDVITIKRDITFEGELFGRVIVVRSMEAARNNIEAHIDNIYLIAIVLMAAFLVLSGTIAYFMITRPIHIINGRLSSYMLKNDDETNFRFYSQEFILLNKTVDQLKNITHGRDVLQEEVEVRKRIQHELEKEREKSDQANRAKTQFLSFMSHEIRTPLTAIIGFSETLLDYNQSMEERLDAIHTVINSSHHLLQLINDVLDISKIEAGRLEIESIKIELVELLKQVVPVALALTKNKDVHFEISCDQLLPDYIVSDPLRIKQVLINIIGNAIKFTKVGSVKLNLTYDAENETLYFQVVDTGIGMTKEQIQNLFAAYSQADMSTAREYGGTGLGLHLSTKLAESLGGGIKVESLDGKGTSFTVSIKTGKVNHLHSMKGIDFSKALYGHVEKLDENLCGKVLLADDVEENQRLIALYIKALGVDVDIVSNGEEAVKLSLSNDYDLMLLDIQMPVLDGLSALKRLRAKGIKTPAIALSANTMPEQIDEYLAAGFDDTASKPIVRSLFKKLMCKYLKPANDVINEKEPIYSALLETEPDFVEIIDQFIERLPTLIFEIDQYFEVRDWQQLKDVLHRVKGVAGNYGYDELMRLLAKAEFAVTAKDEEAFKSLFNLIKDVEARIMMTKN